MKKITVNVSDSVFECLSNRASEKGGKKVSEYVESILEEIAKKLGASAQNKPAYQFSKEEEERVKDRLRALGYMK